MKVLNRLVITIILGSLSINALAIDYSTLDLTNFKYFRYPTRYTDGGVEPSEGDQYQPNIIENGANHVKAVYTYFKNVLIGDPLFKGEQKQIFDPDAGKRNAHLYYERFGYRGQNLIELLGRGYPRDKLIYYGAINKNFEAK